MFSCRISVINHVIDAISSWVKIFLAVSVVLASGLSAEGQEESIIQPADMLFAHMAMPTRFATSGGVDEIINPDGFVVVIQEYVHQSFMRLNEQCAQDTSSESTVCRKALFYFKGIVDSIDENTSLVTLIQILSSGQALCQKLTLIQNEQAAQLEKELTRILLVKSSIVFAKNLRAQAMAAIDLLRPRLHYWVQQEQHQIYYFLHKSPVKIINQLRNGEKQKDEIARNLKELRVAQERYYGLLGALFRHTDEFNSNDVVDDWLIKFFAFGQHILQLKDSALPDYDAEPIQRAIVFAQKCGQQPQMKRMPGMIDNHFARHWITYSGAAITAVAVLGLAYKRPDRMLKKFNSLKDKGYYCGGVVAKSVKRFLNGVWELAKFDDKTHTTPGPVPIPSSVPLVDERTELGEAFDMVQKALRENSKPEMPIDKETFLVRAFNNNEDKVVIDLFGTILTDGSFFEGGINPAGWKLAPAYRSVGRAILHFFTKRLEAFKIEATERYIRADQKLSLVFGALATGGLGTALYITLGVSYSLLKPRPHDFRLIKEALLDIDRILNLYDRTDRDHVVVSAISDADWGRLLYSLDRIAKEVRYVKEPDRWYFERDVDQLALGSLLDVRQKRELIKIMYRQYYFLHESYAAAA